MENKESFEGMLHPQKSETRFKFFLWRFILHTLRERERFRSVVLKSFCVGFSQFSKLPVFSDNSKFFCVFFSEFIENMRKTDKFDPRKKSKKKKVLPGYGTQCRKVLCNHSMFSHF